MSESRIIPLEDIKETATQETQFIHDAVALHYLNQFSPQEILAFETEYKKTVEELETAIKKYKHYFRLEYSLNAGSLISNLLYPVFLIRLGNDGIRNLAHLISDKIDLPDAFVYTANSIFTSGDTLTYLLTFSAKKEAVKTTLAFAHRSSIKKLLQDYVNAAHQHPKKTFVNFAVSCAHQTVLNVTNATSTMTLTLEIMTALEAISPQFKWVFVTIVSFFGMRYLIHFTNHDYYRGVDNFWKNPQNDPWILGEVMRGNIAVPLQIAVQGVLSATLYRAFAFNFYLAVESQKAFGFWPDPWFVFALASWHSACVWLPGTYNYYLRDEINLRKALKEKINLNDIDDTIKNYRAQFDINDLHSHVLQSLQNELIQREVHIQKQILYQVIIHEYGQLYLFKKDKIILFPTVGIAASGAGIAFYYLAPILQTYLFDEVISTSIFSIVVGGVLFGGMFYKAEQNRVLSKLMYEKIQKKDELKTEMLLHKSRCLSGLLSLFNAWLVIGNNASNFIGDIGTGSRILLNEFHTQSTAANLPFVVIAIGKMVNNFLLMGDKVKNVLHGLISPSRFRDSVFYAGKNAVDIVIEETKEAELQSEAMLRA